MFLVSSVPLTLCPWARGTCNMERKPPTTRLHPPKYLRAPGPVLQLLRSRGANAPGVVAWRWLVYSSLWQLERRASRVIEEYEASYLYQRISVAIDEGQRCQYSFLYHHISPMFDFTNMLQELIPKALKVSLLDVIRTRIPIITHRGSLATSASTNN